MNQFYNPDPPYLLDYGDRGSGNYSQMIFLRDINSDNFIGDAADERLNGTRTLSSSGGEWNYDNVRKINYFFWISFEWWKNLKSFT